MANTILILQDEELVRDYLTEVLEDEGYTVFSCEDGEKGIELIPQHNPDLIISDLGLPRMNAVSLIRVLHEMGRDTPIVALTTAGSIQAGIEAINQGVFDYLIKPINAEALQNCVKKALDAVSLKKEGARVSDTSQRKTSKVELLVGSTPRMRELIKVIEKVASSDAPTILLEGESGTGKSFVAQLIHTKSKRFNQPFMDINCASLPEKLIESELFGYEKGAFTDAKQMKPGLFEVAVGGTVFLDEIGEMTLATQAKLLQAIEGRIFRRVGGIEDIATDVRIIAATNVHLKNAVMNKLFREDLYFRLQLIPVSIPPLRERAEDIPLLVKYFIEKFNQEYQKSVQGVSPEAEVFLKSYPWPGNVRELKNVIERITILEADDIILPRHLPFEVKSGMVPQHYTYQIPEQGMNLEEVEKQFITQALYKTQGNQSRAAKLLGLTRHTLRYRMEKFGLH